MEHLEEHDAEREHVGLRERGGLSFIPDRPEREHVGLGVVARPRALVEPAAAAAATAAAAAARRVGLLLGRAVEGRADATCQALVHREAAGAGGGAAAGSAAALVARLKRLGAADRRVDARRARARRRRAAGRRRGRGRAAARREWRRGRREARRALRAADRREAEVADLDVALAVDEDVGGLEVAVEVAVCVQAV